jgi:NTE family protein
LAGITLVLGGGGFKGLAHVGVFEVFQEAGIPIDRVVGTSAGSLIGGMYCTFGDAVKVRETALAFVTSAAFQGQGLTDFTRRDGHSSALSLMGRLMSGIKRQMAFERMFRHSSAFGGAPLRMIVRHLLPRGRIEDLGVPLGICALNLHRGEEVLLTEGDLLSAVVASSAVPGFFPPVERNGQLLCDAGLVNNLPTRLARSLGAVRVVAVDLSASIEPCSERAVGMEVLFRAQDISTRIGNRRWADHADVVLYPQLASRSWLDANEPEEMMAAGAEAARANLDAVRSLLLSSHGVAAPRTA